MPARKKAAPADTRERGIVCVGAGIAATSAGVRGLVITSKNKPAHLACAACTRLVSGLWKKTYAIRSDQVEVPPPCIKYLLDFRVLLRNLFHFCAKIFVSCNFVRVIRVVRSFRQ